MTNPVGFFGNVKSTRGESPTQDLSNKLLNVKFDAVPRKWLMRLGPRLQKF